MMGEEMQEPRHPEEAFLSGFPLTLAGGNVYTDVATSRECDHRPEAELGPVRGTLSQDSKPASLIDGRSAWSVRDAATDFEWDEAKRLSNIAKHGLDFADSDLFLGSPHLVGPAKTVDGETRWLAVGMIDDVYVTTVFTRRGSTVRIISMRRARDGERKKHQEVFGG